MVASRASQYLGRSSRCNRDAERRRSRRSGPRSLAGRCAVYDIHRVTGASAHDPQHVQDRRRADPDGHSRRRTHSCNPCAQHLWRPLRRHVRPPDGFCASLLSFGARGAGHGHGGARGNAAFPDPVPPLLRWLPHVARSGEDRSHRRCNDQEDDRRRSHRRTPAAGAQSERSQAARNGAEPRCVLPSARGWEPLPRRSPRDRASRNGQAWRIDGTQLQAVRIPRRTRR